MSKPPTWRVESKPTSGGPRRRRGGQQVTVLASGSHGSCKAQAHAQAHAQAADMAGLWASCRAVGRGADEAGRKSPSWRANAAAAPPQPSACSPAASSLAAAAENTTHASVLGGPEAPLDARTPPRRSRSPLLPARRQTLPRTMCHNASLCYRQRARRCKQTQPSQTSAGRKWVVDDI